MRVSKDTNCFSIDTKRWMEKALSYNKDLALVIRVRNEQEFVQLVNK